MLDGVLCTYKSDTTSDVLGRVAGTCLQMVLDRGFDVVSSVSDVVDFSLPVVVGRKGEGDTLHVLFHPEDKVGVKTVRSLFATLENGPVTRIVLVSAEGPTPFTRKEMGGDDRIECFQYKNLVVNPTRCSLVPPHSVVSPEERKELEEKYGVGEDGKAWPRIYHKDPVVRYYNWPAGSLVRIERSVGGDKSTYYRLLLGRGEK